MLKIYGNLSFLINVIIKKFGAQYTAQGMTDAINKLPDMKGREKISLTAVRSRGITQRIKWDSKKTKNPRINLDAIKRKIASRQQTAGDYYEEHEVATIIEYFKKSQTIKAEVEREKLKGELLKKLKDGGRKNIQWGTIKEVARRIPLGWGPSKESVREEEARVIRELLAKSPGFESAGACYQAIRNAIPRWAKAYDSSILRRLKVFGIEVPTIGKVPETVRPMGSLSEIPGLRSSLLVCIHSGTLTEKDGLTGLFNDIQQQFKGDFQKYGFTLSIEQFTEFAKELVWTKQVEDSLTNYLRHAVDLDSAIKKWQKSYAYIPLEWVMEQGRWERGVVSSTMDPVSMLPGLGGYFNKDEGDWLKNIPDVEVPRSSVAEPHKITVHSRHHHACNYLVLNGANLGLVYNRIIEENPLRRKLAEAELHGVDVVFLVNVFTLEIIKAGGALMVYRARLSGLNTNINLLDPDYREEARRIMEEEPFNEVVFESPLERVMNLLEGLKKIIMKPVGKGRGENQKYQPEFSGKICMVLGYNEELLFHTLAYWTLNYLRILKQGVLQSEIKLAAQEMAQAKKQKDTKAYKEATQKLERLTKQRARTITSSIRPQDVNRFAPKIRSIILARLKELVPNIEVIGQGTTHVEINNMPVVTLHIPGHKRVSDTLLGDYAATCGPKIIRKTLAKTTIICHPFAIQARDTVREADHDGKRDSVQIFVAPIMVDGQFLREELRDVIRSTHPIQKAIFHDQFKPGALRMTYHGPGGIVAQDFWPITRTLPPPIVHVKRKHSPTEEAKKVLYPDFGRSENIIIMTNTDIHSGGRAQEIVWCEELGKNLRMGDAVIYSQRKSGYLGSKKFGISMWNSNDDPTQGHNYNTERQPDPKQLPNDLFEKLSKEFKGRMEKAKNMEESSRIFTEYQKLVLEQMDVRGLDWIQHQMESLFDRFITPNMDFFSAILSKAKESGLVIKPVSEHYGLPYDPRDLGIINWGTGNHFAHSVEDMMTEGFLYARDMQGKLLQRREWAGQEAFVKKFVCAPLYSNFFCAWGTVRVGDGYEWGMDLRDSPTRMGSWGDTLQGAVRNDVLRGNPSRIMEGRVRLQTYGDKHFFGTAITPDVIFHMCASGTHTDRYGEHGFPPNNTGVSFIGLPVEGPRFPISFRYLRYDQIVQLVQPGVTFDWETFLPKAV